MAGAALSCAMFSVGLLLSSNPDAAGDLVQVPSMLFQGSLLLGLISRATLGYAYVFLHFHAFIGYKRKLIAKYLLIQWCPT